MTLQPATAAPTQAVPRTPAGAFLRYLAVMGDWLKKNLKEALTVAVVGFVIGWVMNFVLMAFFYDGFRADETMAATGQGNVRNGMLIWSLFSSVAFGLVAYRRAVGKERFRHDLANFPGAIVGVFRKDGDAVWTHILWGAAVSLLATFLIARWAGLGVAAALAAAAFSPLGLILAAMITQLWRAIMRSLMPMKTRRATGSAGLFVGLFTSSLVLLAGFFIANEKEKLILGALCLVAAIVIGRRQAAPPAATALWLMAPLLWLLFPELGLADDGGFKEAGGDFSAWAQGGGLGEISGYSNYGGIATAIGGLAGWMAGSVNGVSPPPEGGWEAGLDGEPDLDPGGSSMGDGLPPMTAPIAATGTDPDAVSEPPVESADAGATAEEGADAAGDPEAVAEGSEDPAGDAAPANPPPDEIAAPEPAPPEPLAADGLPDRELTDDEIAALSEEDYRTWRERGPEPDPDSPAGIMRRARAGDPEAIERWEEIRGEGDPSFLDRVGSVVLGPAYDAIGGSETLIELAKTDWIDEGLDTAAALGNAAGRRIGQIADTAVETVSGAVDLAGMDASEVSGMIGAIGDSVANSTVGRIVGDTIDGAVELAGMDADELAGMVGQVRDDAADAVVERIDQARTLVEDMTFEEAVGHLERTRDAAGQALTDADRAIRRQAQEVMRMNPDKVRDALADGTIAVVEELGVEVLTGGLGAARHADDVVDAVRAADNAVDAARAADNTADAARAADRGSDAARAGAPDAPPVRETPDAPARPDAPETPETPRADAADTGAAADPGPEGRGPGPTGAGRRDSNAPAADADRPPTEGEPTRAADPEPPATEAPGGRTGPGDTVELDPNEGPGGVRPPDASRPPAAAASEAPAGSPPARSDEPWTEADTVRTPRRSAEAPGDTDPGGGPARPAPPAADAPNAPDAPDGDLVFEMEDGKRVNMTTNRPEPPRPGSPADLAARGDAPGAPPRADPGADTLPDGAPPARPPDQPDGDLIFEMEDGARVNMTTNRPEPPRPGSPADPAVRADTEILPPGRSGPGGSQRLDPDDLPDARTGPGGTQRLDPDDLPDARTGPGGTQRLDPDDLPDARTGPGGTQRLDPDDLPGARTGPGGTQRLDPDDLPDARTGPGGTQRLDPDDLPDARTGPGGTQRLDPDDLPGGRTGPGGTQRLDPDDLPDARTGPGGTQRLDPDDLPGGSPRPGERAPRPLAEREALANEPYDGPRGLTDKPPHWPDGTRRPPDPSDAAPADLPRSDTPRDGHLTYENDPPYADDPNIDARGRPVPEEVAEGRTAAPLPAGHTHNPLDKAYVDITAPERSAPSIGRGAPEARDDAIRAAHERYQDGVERARENLNNPAFRERMNPEALRELEDAVKPENARSLEDFRRSAGMDPTPPPRAAPPGDDTPTWRGREPPPDETPTLTPGRAGQPPPDDTPTWRGREPPPDDTPTLTPGRPGPDFTEGETVINPGRGGRPAPGSETLLSPGRAPAEPSGPGGTQRLDPDDLPDGRTGPGGTQRLDPDDLPDARTGPGGTQRLDADDLPDARTGPGGTRRLDPDDLPDARTGPGGTQRLDPDDLPDARTGPGGTQRLEPDDLPDARTGPGGTQRLDPDDLPGGRTGPGGTQRLDADDLPDARTGPGGTRRLDPDDLPAARTGPGGTQRLDPDGPPPAGTQRFDPPDLPDARTGPGGTQRLEDGDLPDGRRAAPVDRAPAGPGEEVRPGVRRAPDGTHQVRMSRSEADRILGDAEPGGVSRTAPTERMPPDESDLDDATPTSRLSPREAAAGVSETAPTARLSPDEAGGRGALDAPAPGDRAEAARRANDQFREGMERARRDAESPAPAGDPAPNPADERPSGSSRRAPRAEPPPPAADAPRPPDPDSAPPEEPRPKPRRPRAEPFSRPALPDVPEADFRRYEDVIVRARQDGLKAGGDWPSGGCEEAKLSLLRQVESQPGWRGQADRVGPPGKAFDHEFAISPEGYIVDPVARQFVDRGIWTEPRLQRAGLLEAMNRGIFTPEQWAKFTYARPRPAM